MRRLSLLISALAWVGFAADVTGTWKGTAETGQGTIERTFVFRTNGNTVTGEASSPGLEKSAIADGRLEGDRLSFSLVIKLPDGDLKANYTGTVTGDSIRLHVETSAGAKLDYVVKKVS